VIALLFDTESRADPRGIFLPQNNIGLNKSFKTIKKTTKFSYPT
jgi:hypothetical protein